MQDNDRSAIIRIGSEDYQLILTTRTTKEIAKRYSGLENLGTKLMKTENFEMALDEVVWLITLLANQSILIHNLKNQDKRELLTEETVEFLTSPLELAAYKDAIIFPVVYPAKLIDVLIANHTVVGVCYSFDVRLIRRSFTAQGSGDQDVGVN